MHQREASPHPWTFLQTLKEVAEQVLLWLGRGELGWGGGEASHLWPLGSLPRVSARPGPQVRWHEPSAAPKAGSLVVSPLWGAQLSPPSLCHLGWAARCTMGSCFLYGWVLQPLLDLSKQQKPEFTTRSQFWVWNFFQGNNFQSKKEHVWVYLNTTHFNV